MNFDPEGADFFSYGNSLIPLYADAVGDAYGGTNHNRGQGGPWADVAKRMLSTTHTWTPGTSGILILDGTGGHALGSDFAPTDQRFLENGLRASLATAGAHEIVADDDASITYTGAWSTDVTDSVHYFHGGDVHSTTAAGAQASITFAGDKITLIFFMWQDGYLGVHNASFTIKQDETTLHTYTSSDEVDPGTIVNGPNTHVVVELTNFGPGTHTVDVKHAGTAGHTLSLDGYIIPADDPVPEVFVTLPSYFTPAGYAAGGAGSDDATVDQYAELVADVCADYPWVNIVDPRPDFEPDTMTFDGIHLSATGIDHYVAKYVAAIDAAFRDRDP